MKESELQHSVYLLGGLLERVDRSVKIVCICTSVIDHENESNYCTYHVISYAHVMAYLIGGLTLFISLSPCLSFTLTM